MATEVRGEILPAGAGAAAGGADAVSTRAGHQEGSTGRYGYLHFTISS